METYSLYITRETIRWSTAYAKNVSFENALRIARNQNRTNTSWRIYRDRDGVGIVQYELTTENAADWADHRSAELQRQRDEEADAATINQLRSDLAAARPVDAMALGAEYRVWCAEVEREQPCPCCAGEGTLGMVANVYGEADERDCSCCKVSAAAELPY